MGKNASGLRQDVALLAVTAGPGSAGEAFKYNQPTKTVELANYSQAVAAEFQVNGGAWRRLDGGAGITVECNLASDVVRVRRTALEGGDVKVRLAVERNLDPSANPGVTAMFIGDSITINGSIMAHIPEDAPVRAVYPTLTNINSAGNFVMHFYTSMACPTGAGAILRFYADNTMTWQAAGDTEGPRVAVGPESLYYILPSGTPGYEAYLGVLPRLKPTGDKADVLGAITGIATHYSDLSTYGLAGWVKVLLGCALQRSLTFAVSGSRAADWIAARSQWEGIYTDITHVFPGTNDIVDRASALQCLTDVEAIVTARLAIGSKVIAGCLLPYDARSPAASAGVAEYSMGLRAMGERLRFKVWDAWQYVANSNGAGGFATNFAKDGLHPSGIGAFVIAKRAIVPVMRDMVRDAWPVVPAGIAYNAATAPYANIIPNALLAGIGGSVSAGVTGTVPNGWYVVRDYGTNITAVCTAPESAGAPALSDGRQAKAFGMVLSNPGAAPEAIRFRSLNWVAAGVIPGSMMVMEGEFTLSGTGIRSVEVMIGAAGGSAPHNCSVLVGDTSTNLLNLDGDTVTFKFRSRPFRVQPGVNSFTIGMVVALLAGGAAQWNIAPTLNLHAIPA